MLATINLLIGKTSKTSSKESFVQSMQTQQPSTDWNPQLISKRVAPWMNTSMNSKTLSVIYTPPCVLADSKQSELFPLRLARNLCRLTWTNSDSAQAARTLSQSAQILRAQLDFTIYLQVSLSKLIKFSHDQELN